MEKKVQILLSRPLNVNLGKDENGQPKSIKLVAGLQEVDREVADNWFVKSHCQEISSQDAQNGELQALLDKANEDLKILQTQSDAATAQITQLQNDLKDRDQEIKNLKVRLDKAEQTQSDVVKSADLESTTAETTKTTKAK